MACVVDPNKSIREAFSIGLILTAEMKKRRIRSDVIARTHLFYSQTLPTMKYTPIVHFTNFMNQPISGGTSRYARSCNMTLFNSKTIGICQNVCSAVLQVFISQRVGSYSTMGLMTDQISSDSSDQTLPSLDSGVCSQSGGTFRNAVARSVKEDGCSSSTSISEQHREVLTKSAKNRNRIRSRAIAKHHQSVSSSEQLRNLHCEESTLPFCNANKNEKAKPPSTASSSATHGSENEPSCVFSNNVVAAALIQLDGCTLPPGLSDKVQRFLTLASSSDSENDLLSYVSKPTGLAKEQVRKIITKVRQVGVDVNSGTVSAVAFQTTTIQPSGVDTLASNSKRDRECNSNPSTVCPKSKRTRKQKKK